MLVRTRSVSVWRPGRGCRCCCWPGWGRPGDRGLGKPPPSPCGCCSAAETGESGRGCVWKPLWEVPGCRCLEDLISLLSVKKGDYILDGTRLALNILCKCVWIRNLVNSGRNLSQVLVDAGHGELDLVTDALLWTFCCLRRRDADEQQDPEGVRTELRVHLRGK